MQSCQHFPSPVIEHGNSQLFVPWSPPKAGAEQADPLLTMCLGLIFLDIKAVVVFAATCGGWLSCRPGDGDRI